MVTITIKQEDVDTCHMKIKWWITQGITKDALNTCRIQWEHHNQMFSDIGNIRNKYVVITTYNINPVIKW